MRSALLGVQPTLPLLLLRIKMCHTMFAGSCTPFNEDGADRSSNEDVEWAEILDKHVCFFHGGQENDG